MRVALVNVTTTTKVGGVETFVWQLAQALATRDVDVTVFGGTTRRQVMQAGAYGVPVITSPFIDRAAFRAVPLLNRRYGLAKMLERLTYGVMARGAIEGERFDIVHIHKPFDFPLAARVRKQTGARIVYSSHGRDFFTGDRRFVNAIDAMTACSAYNAAEVQERYGRAATVIFNGIETDLFIPSDTDRAWRQTIGVGDAPLALWVGRLERWKGTIDAVRAIALLAEPVHLAIVGGGPEASRLKDAARSLGIAERVHLLGTIAHAQLPAIYASADVVLGTSFANETFGMSLAEASACACPVIATAFGGFPEVVQDGVTGKLVPPRDPAALARAIAEVLRDPPRAARMGEAGRAFVTEHFAWPVVTDRVLAIYTQVRDAA